MGVGNRAATCTACGKRLNRKQWYYRNGQYFCKKRCWVTEHAKQTQSGEGAPPAGAEAAPTAASKKPSAEASAAPPA